MRETEGFRKSVAPIHWRQDLGGALIQQPVVTALRAIGVHGDSFAGQLNGPSLRSWLAGLLMQHRGPTDKWMAGERQFLKKIKYSRSNRGSLSGGLEEHGLEVTQLLGYQEHLIRGQSRRVREYRETVAAVWSRAENVDMHVISRHCRSLEI